MRHSILIAALMVSGMAFAQEGSEVHQRIYVLEQMDPYLKGRLEVAPLAGYVLNDAYFHQLAAGGNLAYHISDEWGVGASFVQYWSSAKDFYSEVQRDYFVFPGNVRNQWGAGGFVTWAPVRGKVALYPLAVMHLRLYLKAGAGALKTSSGKVRPNGELGAGLDISLTSWWTIFLEACDQMYVEKYLMGSEPDGTASTRSEFKNQAMVRAGFGFLIPLF